MEDAEVSDSIVYANVTISDTSKVSNCTIYDGSIINGNPKIYNSEISGPVNITSGFFDRAVVDADKPFMLSNEAAYFSHGSRIKSNKDYIVVGPINNLYLTFTLDKHKKIRIAMMCESLYASQGKPKAAYKPVSHDDTVKEFKKYYNPDLLDYNGWKRIYKYDKYVYNQCIAAIKIAKLKFKEMK